MSIDKIANNCVAVFRSTPIKARERTLTKSSRISSSVVVPPIESSTKN